MLCSIIDDVVESQADMMVVGTFHSCADLLANASRIRADVAVIGMGNGIGSPVFDDVLFALGRARCLAIPDDGKESFLYELRPHRAPAGALSLDELVSVIRGELPLDVPQAKST